MYNIDVPSAYPQQQQQQYSIDPNYDAYLYSGEGSSYSTQNTVSKKTDHQKGKFLFVSQIMAQGTKVNTWEFVVTKADIRSFIVPKLRTSIPANHLI